MEQKQITLEEIYLAIQKMQQELHNLNDRLGRSDEFTEEENKEFDEGTRQAWEEIDEGKGKKMSIKEFLGEIKSLKKDA